MVFRKFLALAFILFTLMLTMTANAQQMTTQNTYELKMDFEEKESSCLIEIRKGQKEKVQVSIFDSQGRVIRKGFTNHNGHQSKLKFDLNHLEPGMYKIELQSKTLGFFQFEKIQIKDSSLTVR